MKRISHMLPWKHPQKVLSIKYCCLVKNPEEKSRLAWFCSPQESKYPVSQKLKIESIVSNLRKRNRMNFHFKKICQPAQLPVIAVALTFFAIAHKNYFFSTLAKLKKNQQLTCSCYIRHIIPEQFMMWHYILRTRTLDQLLLLNLWHRSTRNSRQWFF